MKKFLSVILIGLILLTGCSSSPKEMSNTEFFRSLDYSDGVSASVSILHRFPLQYIATESPNGYAEVGAIEFKFVEDDVFYFTTSIYYNTYTNLMHNSHFELCVGDYESEAYIKLKGNANFTTDEEIINKAYGISPAIRSIEPNNYGQIIAFYLTNLVIEIQSFDDKVGRHTYNVPNKFD